MNIFKKKKKRSSVTLITDKQVPFSYVEAYKSLRTNLNFYSSTKNSKVFAVTSALPEEGKSSVSINTAIALAAGNKKVILVDCDLRKPNIHRILKISRSQLGLTSVLTGAATLEEGITKVKNLNIDVLTAGMLPLNPSEILETDRMKSIVRILREHYDYVILDTPPVSVVTDGAVIGRMADGAILVIRSKYAAYETVQLAQRRLQDVGVNILGVILNNFDPKNANKRSGYSYSYSYEYGKE